MTRVQLLQLPLHPTNVWEPTGNIPLAPARLAAAAGLPPDTVFPGDLLSSLGDRALLEELHRRQPEVIGVTLYLWNRDRTVHLLREYRTLDNSVLVVAGGPEVTADNHILLDERSIDLFVAGEGESRAGEVLNPESLRKLLDSGERFIPPIVDTSPPDRWPDPYETGHIYPSPGGSVHMETQRGCSCLCSYCAYRRTSPVPRITPAETSLKKIRGLLEKGATEFVFLDPTFNARNDLHVLLEGMAGMDAECFAEVRGDLISGSDASAMKSAGFGSLEVGLQTMSEVVLRSVGRGGSPGKIIRGADLLKQEGITPVIDLILGLPDDRPENVENAAETLLAKHLNEQVQTFCLSVLPGTALRLEADTLGIRYMDRPPYIATRSGRYTLSNLLEARERISDILGYDADPPPRPVLCDNFPGTEIFHPENPGGSTACFPRHGVLRILSNDPWTYREEIMGKILQRREIDPSCPLDVILETENEFPLDLLDHIRAVPEPSCYDREKAFIYNVPSLIRTAVVAGKNAAPQWLDECSHTSVTVVRSETATSLFGGRIGILLEGEHDLSELLALYGNAPELVFFRDFNLEKLWNLDVLELG